MMKGVGIWEKEEEGGNYPGVQRKQIKEESPV